MESKIIQEFKGEIEGFKIKNSSVYYATKFIGEAIEKEFGKVFNKDFIPALANTIERMESKYDEFSYATLESEFYKSIKEAKKFSNIKFTYYGSEWKIEDLNEGIEKGKYSNINKILISKKSKVKEDYQR